MKRSLLALPEPRSRIRRLASLLTLVSLIYLFYTFSSLPNKEPPSTRILERCKAISTPAGPPPNFKPSSRIQHGSDRHVPGTPPTLIRNAKIWTGTGNGTDVVFGDILLDNGLIFGVGRIPPLLLNPFEGFGGDKRILVVDVGGKWVTPGLVDLHSHIGVMSAPGLNGGYRVLALSSSDV